MFSEFLQEELEEGAQTTIYDNFKFLTREDLERLNLTNLIGTNLLQAYMHGFFVDYRLYKKVRLSSFLFLIFHKRYSVLFSEILMFVEDVLFSIHLESCMFFIRNICKKIVLSVSS